MQQNGQVETPVRYDVNMVSTVIAALGTAMTNERQLYDPLAQRFPN
jgi:hypothetical protein